jgi:hypothetical protein
MASELIAPDADVTASVTPFNVIEQPFVVIRYHGRTTQFTI